MKIKHIIKKHIRNKPSINNFLNLILMFKNATFKKIDGGLHKYPKIIQLPITYKCNSRCVMCDIWNMDFSNEMDIKEFTHFISDPIFKEVKAVGINGGEPSLLKNLSEFIDVILQLPKITSINIISHGFNSKRLLDSVSKIYKKCKANNVYFHVSISLDGVGTIHDEVRQIPNGFQKTIFTIRQLVRSQQNYCDSYDLGCTVINQNIDHLMELDTFAKENKFIIKYRLGIDNKRIGSDKLRDQYSVIYSPLRQSALEFFHYQIHNSTNLVDRFKYYSIFTWLNSPSPKRLLGCSWKDEGITLDARGELYYCAVASRSLGTLRKEAGEKIFFKKDNIEYRKSIINDNCDECIHDYSGKVEVSSILEFFKDLLKNRIAMYTYKIKSFLII